MRPRTSSLIRQQQEVLRTEAGLQRLDRKRPLEDPITSLIHIATGNKVLLCPFELSERPLQLV